jgi:hypothetical protein
VTRAGLLLLLVAVAGDARVVSHAWQAGTLTLQLEDGTAEVEWISAVAFRFTRSLAGETRVTSPIRHDPVLVSLQEENGSLRMRSRYITVEIDRASVQIRVRAGEQQVATLQPDLAATGGEVRFGPLDKVFGLRAEGAKLNLRGETLERANGFWFTNAGYGMAFRAPEVWRFDLAGGVARASGAKSLEYVFYHGPTPKEILEHHRTVTSPGEVPRRSLAVLQANQLPSAATRLPQRPVDSWEALAALVRTLNHWSLSAVLYPALDLATIEKAPPEVKQRALDLAALAPMVYNSGGAVDLSGGTRQALTPHLTTYLREAFDRGFPLIHPLPFQFPRDANSDQQADVFMLGDEFLVAPVVTPGERRRLTLPRGLWTDLRTNTEYRGNQEIEVDAPPGRAPMFARNGSLFPIAAGERMELHYVPSLGGEFFLWEPDLLDNSQFHASPAGDFLRAEVETKVRRTYEWVLHHTPAPREVLEADTAYRRAASRGELRAGTWWHDAERNNLHVVLAAEPDTDRIVNIAFAE